MNNEKENNNKKSSFNWLWLIVAALIIAAIVYMVNTSGTGEKSIGIDQFIADIGASSDGGKLEFNNNNKIEGVYKEGNTYYLMYREISVPESEREKFYKTDPKKYCTAYIYDSTGAVAEILTERILQQETNPALTLKIKYIADAVPASWVDNIIPWLYLIGSGVLIYFMFRMFASRSGLNGMTRNRATVVINGGTRFADVAGIEEEKEQVAEIVDFLKNPKKYIAMGARIPKGVLLVGQPGTGKTLLAKAIAGEAGVPFFSISGSDFSEMLVGVGPSRMRDLFEQAKANAPAIIFLDEIDSIARMRGIGTSGVSEENEQTLNQLLVQMDGFTKSEGVIVIAATNRPDVLDVALLRPGRFDRQIIVQMPDVKGREQILKVHSKNKPFDIDMDFNRIAKITSGFSGADIENLLNESAIISAKDNRSKITMSDVMEGINKVLMGPQKKSRIITENDKKITAYHEAGHAIVSRILIPEQTVQEVSIIPRGVAAGYTLTNDQDNEHSHQSLTELKKRITMLLGGRCAEQLFIGDICTGASNDIKVATDIAEKMVTQWGMSDKLGPLYYGKESEVALRFYKDKHTSESLQSVIDAEIKALIIEAQTECKKILSANKDKCNVMAKVLLSRETVYAEDIALIMDGKDENFVIKTIETRENERIAKENESKASALLAQFEPLLKRSADTANAFKDANLISVEKLLKLKANFDLANAYIKTKMKLPPVPTLDNIDKYAEMVKIEEEVPDKSETEKSAQVKTKTVKKTAAKKKTKEEKTNGRNKNHSSS
jgi:cell division protease FtsH